MEKDPNKEILDNIKKVKFYGVSSEEEMESYVKQKNQQQRADGVVDKDNFHSINLKEKPDDETKKARLKINACDSCVHENCKLGTDEKWWKKCPKIH